MTESCKISLSVKDSLNHVHLISKKDLHNLRQSFGIQGTNFKVHESDVSSMTAWVKEMKEHGKNNPVVFQATANEM